MSYADLDHPERAREMAQNGREYCLSHFNWDVISQRYIQLIHQTWKVLGEVPRDLTGRMKR